MSNKRKQVLVSLEKIERQIHVVRGQRVMIDADLAALYGVPTKVLNQAVKRNGERFPTDFSFLLTQQEFTDLRSQVVTSSSTHGGRRYFPRVFTEHGVAMLSSVLRSRTAIRVNIEIMRAFVRLRRLLATPGDLVTQITQLAETLRLHHKQIKTITEVLNQMIEPPAEIPKRRIGFRAPNEPEESDVFSDKVLEEFP